MNPTEILLQTRLFRVEQLTHLTGDGTSVQRQVIRHPGSVTIIPVVDRDRICLIRNHRVAAAQTLLELPAGTRNPGETPLETARRELIEETGYRAGRIEPLHEFYVSPGILDERMHLFVAEDLTAGKAEREVGEEIQNHLVTWDEALEGVRDGSIQDAKTIIGILLYDRFRR